MGQYGNVGPLALMGIFAFVGCDATSENELEIQSFEQFMLERTKVFEDQTIYVIDGDIAVSKDELRGFYDLYVEDQKRRAYGFAVSESGLTVNVVRGRNDVWSTSQASSLTYCVSNEFGSAKTRMVNEMNQAAADLEAVGNYDFIYVSSADANCTGSNGSVVFAVRPWTSGGACAFFPSGGGCVSRTVVMDLNDLDTNPGYGNVTSLGVLRHELGHVLGLRHEHIRVSGTTCSEGGRSRAVTAYDSDSMMHYPWCPGGTNTADLEVTTLDGQGLDALYPTGGGGGGGGGQCLDPGEACSSNSDCCSNRCRRNRGTCR